MQKVSVIIPVKDDESRLRACVDCLLSTSSPELLKEILVVDNGSRCPVTESSFNSPLVKVLICAERGSYAARNFGLGFSSGDIVAFTDSDCLPAQDWVSAGTNYFRESATVQIIAGRVEVFPKKPESPSPEEYYDMLFAFPQRAYVEKSHFGVTANLFVRRCIMATVGGFDDRLFSGGDREWGIRAWNKGVLTHYADEVRVRHPARSTWRELEKKVYRVAEGLVQGGDGLISRSELERRASEWSFPIRNMAYCVVKTRRAPLITRLNAARVIWRLHFETRKALRLALEGNR